MKFLKLLALFTTAAALYAQDYRATIQGQVTDGSNAVIPNVTVRAINTQTGAVKDVKTTNEGLYVIPYLDPGTYNIEAAASGFQTLRRTDVVLRVADKLNLPLQLNIGQMAEQVTVVGNQEVIETTTADRGLVFDPIKTQEYPLNGRQTYMLLSLTPGVIFTQEQFGASGFSGTRGWDVNSSYKINGARTGQNLFLLNGAPISDQGGMWQLAPNVEAVEEFKVMTNTYDASYGRFGGGVVNTTLKSGTNNWNGNVFEYFRNRVFDANSFQNNVIGAPRGFHNQHQFGGIAGGPIRKEKDFIFGSFEGWQEVVPFPALSSVPPLPLRDGQHFTDYGYKIYDPLTRRMCAAPDPCGGQSFINDPFPGNVIPQSRISPVGSKILSYFPAPNGEGINNNFVARENLGRYYYNQPMGRWDHVFSGNDKLYALVTYQRGYEFRSTTGFPKPAATGNTDNRRLNQNYIAAWNHIVSPTTVLDIRASYGRFTQITPGYNDQAAAILAKDIGMTNMPFAPTYPNGSLPAITSSGYGRLFAADNSISQRVDNQYNFTPSLNMTRGRHNLRVGFELNYVARAEISSGAAAGLFDFNAGWTQQRSGSQQNTFDGSTVASILLGHPASGRVNYNDTTYRTRPYYGWYIQDDWKLSQKLSVNLGLRYDVQIPWIERFDRTNRGFDPYVKNPLSDQVLANWKRLKAEYDAANPNAKYPYPAPPAVITGGFLFPGKDGQSRRLYDTDWTNIAPRIGIAYRLTDNGKTVLRTGIGVFYQSPTQFNTTSGYQQQTNFIATSPVDGIRPSSLGSQTGPYSLANPFPNGIAAPLGSSAGLLTNVGNGGISFDPSSFKVPRTYQYSFGIQQELPGRILLETSYTGNYQIYVTLGYDMNAQGLAAQQLAIADPNYYSRTLANPFQGLIPNNGSLGAGATVSAANLLRPFPLFNGGITNNLIQAGHYRSDQLQVSAQKRMLGGERKGVFTWVVSYTWAKAFEANHRLNSWNTAEPIIYELDNTDKAHSLAVHGVYDLPFGRGQAMLSGGNSVVRELVSNWRSSWIYTYFSGNPTGWPDVINKCGTWKIANQNENAWFNNDKTCYQQNPTNNIRTIPDRFGNIRNPGVGPFLNFALEKTVQLSERYKFLIRGEAFNVTNSVQRPGPDTSFTSARFGQLPKEQLNFPRFIQLAAKFYF